MTTARMRPLRHLLVVCLVVCLAVAACIPSDRGGSGDGDNLAQARTMLRQRSTRLLAGDADGFLRTVTDAARPLEEAIARGAASVPLASLDFVFIPTAPDVSAPAFRAVRTEVRYRYREVPEENVFRFVVDYDIERHGDAWLITASRPAGPLPYWVTGPVTVSTSDHFVALFRPGTTRVAEALDLAEKARRNLAPKLTLELDQRHVMLLAANRDEFREATGEDLPESVPAVAQWDARGLELPVNRRLAVNLEFLFGTLADQAATREHHGELTQAQVFQHELAHLALTRYQSPATPGWVVEGAAMFLAGERRTGVWRRGVEQGAFEQMSFTELNRLASLPTGRHHAYANAAVLHLVETHGAPKFWEFYRSFRNPGSAGDVSVGAQSLQRIYGLDEATLDRATREYIKKAVAR